MDTSQIIMRRTLIIIVIVITILGIGGATYFFFFLRTANVTIATPSSNIRFPSAGQNSSFGSIPTKTEATQASSTKTFSRLTEISAGPIVPGEVVVTTPAVNASSSPDTLVKYIERRSGNIYSYSVTKGILTRISNKTIPGIQNAKWLPNGMTTFIQYLSGANSSIINTYSLTSSKSDGFFLPQDLADIAVSSAGILTLASGVNGSSASLYNLDGSRSTELFTTPLSSLRLQFAGPKHYLAFTKASATLNGYAYLIDDSGNFSRIAGPEKGLVALTSHSGKWVLISYLHKETMDMELINTETREIVPLPVATIVDKCVWAADDSVVYCGIPKNSISGAILPDDWYQGAIHFSDRIWKINVSGRYAKLLLDFPKQTNSNLDAEALSVDSANTTLTFVNKNDGSLWVYTL